MLVDRVGELGEGLELLGGRGVVAEAVLAQAEQLAHARRVGQRVAQRTQDAQRLALAVVGERVGRAP